MNYKYYSAERAEELVSAITNDETKKEATLYECVDSLLNADLSQVSGSADAFHNLAVTCVKTADDFLTAYEVVCLGLKLHSKDTDLLADAIKYGYNCARLEECAEHYNKLRNIKKRYWTWRAYSFSIDYLREICCSDDVDETMESEIEQEIRSLVEFYQESDSNPDDCLSCQYEAEKQFGKKTDALKLLDDALESELPYPKCMLKYADILVERGKHKDALAPINKILNNPQALEFVNIGYVHYLNGLCLETILLPTKKNGSISITEYDEQSVFMVYDEYRCALNSSDTYPSLKTKISNKIKELQNKVPDSLKYIFERK